MDQIDNKNKIVLFAETNFRNQRIRFGIKQDDRRRHMYVIGKTGVGKSTMLENMIIQDIRSGRGVAVVDPHGDLVEKVINFIPSSRINDVVYFNPADLEWPIAFNVLEAADIGVRHLVSSGLIGIFKKLWADTWGPRLEYVLRNAILALMDYPGSTLLGIMRILIDKNYRKKVIDKVQDPIIKSFWTEEYTKYSGTFQVEAINPIQNKVGQFISNPISRNIIGQTKSSIDIREIIDNQKILLVNLAKGRIGEDISSLLGAMMITKIQLSAMERINVSESQRQDFYLYVDEFQNFATESFANILSEARKYRLNLIIAHQYIEQLDEKVQAAVFGNVGTIACFRVGASDAEYLVKEFTPRFMEEDLVNLAKYDIYVKLMIDGVSSEPFSATTLPPLEPTTELSNLEKIIKVSRERYAKPRALIEEKIARWTGMDENNEEEKREPEKNKKNASEPEKKERNYTGAMRISDFSKKYEATCSNCGKTTFVSFEPDNVRPVYCKDCLRELKNKKTENIILKSERREPVNSSKEISLKDIIKQKPVSFRLNKKEQFDAPKTEAKSRDEEKNLKPGEIIKFNS
ncbi:MAG: CxxC-x17-CxxC domain-containing protein [bacterium]